MKREFIIIGSIVIIIIIASVTSQLYTNSFFDSIIEDLYSIEDKVLNNNFADDELEKEMDGISDKWKKKYNFLACFLEHDELEKVRNQYVSIRANIIVDDYGRCVDEIERCIFLLQHIKEKDSFNLVNIF